MLHCLVLESLAGLAAVTVFSSLKKREAAASKLSGIAYLKLAVPDEISLRGLVAQQCARNDGKATYSKPQRRSIAWVEDGVRLRVKIDYDLSRIEQARLEYARELWGF